ncbi:hypothetical protein [Halocatena halophila]|uniref:hypothetical protein n=1 Tax=Halocatena halophila TaxID=2814576 RepID=UPI002ED44110
MNSKRTDGPDVETTEWMLSVDDQLLDHFASAGPGLCPEAAGRLGLHVSFAKKRCETLCEHGLLYESDTVYDITELGETYLETRE